MSVAEMGLVVSITASDMGEATLTRWFRLTMATRSPSLITWHFLAIKAMDMDRETLSVKSRLILGEIDILVITMDKPAV